MFLYYLCGFCLFTLGSGSILSTSSLQERQDSSEKIIFPDDEEGLPTSFQAFAHVNRITKTIEKLLKGQHDYFLSKMKSLETTCKPTNRTSHQVTEYQLPAEPFKDPRINMLVKVMTKKMTDIASIVMDDLEQKLNNFSTVMAKRIQDKFSPLNSKVRELHQQMATLATKSAFVQLRTGISNLIISNTAALKEHLRTLSSKSEFTKKTQILGGLSNALQQKVAALKPCEDFAVLEEVMKMATKSTEELAKAKKSFLDISSMRESCPNLPEESLLTLKEISQETNFTMHTISLVAEDMGPYFSSILQEINAILRGAYGGLESQFISQLTTPLPTNSPTKTISTPNPDQCQDSTFVTETKDGPNLDVCNAAILLQKCDVHFVAFHCCRSCKAAGLLNFFPNDFSDSRSVPLLMGLRAIQP